jgi:hypothetical protein
MRPATAGPALATHGEATPAAAVSGWVAAVLRGDLPDVCARTYAATTTTICPTTNSALASLRTAWGKDLHGAAPQVSAVPLTPAGPSVVFTDGQITVNGLSLRAIELQGASMSPGGASACP